MRIKDKIIKSIALFFAVTMSVSSMQTIAFAKGTPRVAVQMSMSTNTDKSNEVGPNDEITAVVTWKSVLASAGEPITIRVTNGAEILISNEEDVEFKANGIAAPIKSVSRNSSGDTITFKSGAPASSPLENKITFKVQAPSSTGQFNLSVKIGSDTTADKPSINFVEKELTVNPFRLLTSLNVIDGSESFEVFGKAVLDDAFMVAMEMHNKETGEVVFEATTMDISSDGQYTLGSFAFNDSHAIGEYVIDAVLLDSNFNSIATSTKEIERIKTVIIYDDISIKYKDDSGTILGSYTEQHERGSSVTISPQLIFSSNYEFIGSLLNGQSVEGDKVPFTVTGPAEVVFQYEQHFEINLILSTETSIEGQVHSVGHKKGTVVDVTAPEKTGFKVVGVLINDQRTTLMNGNQVRVTITGTMNVNFEYRRL